MTLAFFPFFQFFCFRDLSFFGLFICWSRSKTYVFPYEIFGWEIFEFRDFSVFPFFPFSFFPFFSPRHMSLPQTHVSHPETCLSASDMSPPQRHVPPPETCLSPRHMSPPQTHVSSPDTCLCPRDMSLRQRHVSMAQISLPAIEERSGRVQKAKIGPNMFFSDLTNDQGGLLNRVR